MPAATTSRRGGWCSTIPAGAGEAAGPSTTSSGRTPSRRVTTGAAIGPSSTIGRRPDASSCSFARDYASEPIPELIDAHKLLRLGEQLFVLITVKHQETTPQGPLTAPAIQVVTFSLAQKKFGKPLGLKNYDGQAELCLKSGNKLDNGKPVPLGRQDSPSLGLFDATFLGKSCLCIGAQSTIYFYGVGQIPAPLAGQFTLDDVPELGLRTKEVFFPESQHGNNWGLAPISDRELLVVDMGLPGKVTVLDVDDPGRSHPLTPQIDPTVGGWGGFRALCLRTSDLLVANVQGNTEKIYRIDRASGAVQGTFAKGFAALEIVQIP